MADDEKNKENKEEKKEKEKGVVLERWIKKNSGDDLYFKCCLVMIVKNEAHVIREALQNTLNQNTLAGRSVIDGYIIMDTGSTDGTQDVIRQFFYDHKFPGEVIDRPWNTEKKPYFDFGVNRTMVIRLCEGRSKYALMMDADDLIEGKPDWPLQWTADSYSMVFGTNFTYTRQQVFRLASRWVYEMPLHEYPCCSKKNASMVLLQGDYNINSRRLGARNKTKDKYLKDAMVFENLIKVEMTRKRPSKNRSRMFFYAGNSWYDDGRPEHYDHAIRNYDLRIAEKGWKQEVYISYYRKAELMERKGTFPVQEIIAAFFQTFLCMPNRSEALHRVMTLHWERGEYKQVVEHGRLGLKNAYKTEHLFAVRDIYEYALRKLMMEAAYNCGMYAEVVKLGLQFLKQPRGKTVSDHIWKEMKDLTMRCLQKKQNNAEADQIRSVTTVSVNRDQQVVSYQLEEPKRKQFNAKTHRLE